MRRRVMLFVLPCAPVLLLLVGASYVRSAREHAELQKLFDAPAVRSVPDPVSYHPAITYDLSLYNAAPSKEQYATVKLPLAELPRERTIEAHKWADGAGRDELEARMRQRAAVDGVTAASRLVRLQSPTVYRARRASRRLRISYPPDGALFPPHLCTPCVEWEDAANDVWQVIVRVEDTEREWQAFSREKRWWFPPHVWTEVLREGAEHPVSIEVKGTQRNSSGNARTVQLSPPVRFRISPDPCDAFVVYRLVRPPFSTLKTPDTFVRDIRSFKTRIFLSARRSYCFNCHTFSSKLGTTGKLGVQARYMLPGPETLRTYFGIFDIDRQAGYRIQLPFEVQMTTFMSWSPQAKRLATSANQQLATLQPIVHETQYAGQPTSDIAICDLEQKTARLLPGASHPDELEIYPRWTPDGQSLIFCWSPAGVHPALVKYDLRVIPFNEGNGGNASPVAGASNNGRSNYYPRFSPDGKWMSFCQSNGGCLIKASSDIYLMPADRTGAPRRLECNSEFTADSWHSWSSNGRWLVFASKRDDGIFARLYLTHIDEKGRASPAVRVPVRQLPLECFNIPEFVKNDPAIKERELFQAIRVQQPPVAITKSKGSS